MAKRSSNGKDVWLTVSEHRHPAGYGGVRGQIPVHFTVAIHRTKESAEQYKRDYQSQERGIELKVVGLNFPQAIDIRSHVPFASGGIGSASGAEISNPRRRKKRGADEEDEALAELEAEFPTRLSSHVVANRGRANQAEIAVELATQYGPQAIAMAQKYGPAVVAGVKKALEARKK